MSNTENNQDEATLALWSAAETGEFGEVQAVLSRVADINARNEHGVTALMRAAQHGHARVVRLLLLHGADANMTRNDKFTALSLAAFFGHTEVVRMLMEHGADSTASTRHGTSPHMWATARTFNEVVHQLKEPESLPRPPRDEERAETTAERFAPAAAPVVRQPVTAAIVRTLKDPPEIWDLVHEVPKGFNASSTFMDHLHSMRRGLVFRLATVAVLICAGVVGVLMLRGAQARSEATPQQAEIRSVQPVEAAPAAAPSTFIAPPPESTVTTQSFTVPTTQRRRSHSSVSGIREVEGQPAGSAVTSESVQRIETQNGKTNLPNEKTVQTEANSTTKPTSITKSSSPLSPQLITPAKNVSPKSKVIQWP